MLNNREGVETPASQLLRAFILGVKTQAGFFALFKQIEVWQMKILAIDGPKNKMGKEYGFSAV